MCWLNFRVKVDLSQFYNDVRRSSWVYVDNGSINNIGDLKDHITKLFDINESFHLLLDSGEYLPPNEDARILKEHETILVVPGTGLQNDISNGQETVPDVLQQKENQNECVSDLVVPAKAQARESSDEEGDWPNPMETTNENTVFLSMINTSLMDTGSDSKPDVSTLAESVASDTSFVKNKRKRVRRKKSKNVTAPEELSANGRNEIEYKKPKVISTVTVSNGKHIRFGEVEKLEWQGYDSSVSNNSRRHDSKAGKNGIDNSYWDKPVAGSNLSNLLALRQSSTPITFGRKKTEDNITQGNETEKCEKDKETAIDKQLVVVQSLTVDPKKHPLIVGKAKVNDVVAFKMLKMGNDYTPQVSDHIIGQLIHISNDTSTYMFKILVGKTEVQAPQGKFDLEIEESENTETDLIALNWSQLIEPRLIYRV